MPTPIAPPPLAGFKERLLAELTPLIAEQTQPTEPRTAARWRSPARIAVATVAVTGLCAAAAVTIDSVTGEPAYAMVRHPDGSITLTFNDIDNLRGLRQKLSDYGVRSLVLVRDLPKAGVEPCDNDNIVPAPGFVARSASSGSRAVAVIHPDKQPAGATLVFNIIRTSKDGWMMGINVQKPPKTALCAMLEAG
ncbi:hypothetical protein [Actinomadura nitritigenes]|uniref:hypothetical protein n=1 Tax=Actinomadura nitritigenes TaxID=134602 RepID=UPI003D930A47